RFKKREILRIALADILAVADLPGITRALSLLADVLVDRAVRMARMPLERRFGRPTCRDDQGHLEDATFSVIALGKLGGEELNYSGDIDLVYLFSRDGETSGTDASGASSISNREFFARLAADITRLIAGPGPEGQVFRVDLGLRPGGSDGDIRSRSPPRSPTTPIGRRRGRGRRSSRLAPSRETWRGAASPWKASSR